MSASKLHARKVIRSYLQQWFFIKTYWQFNHLSVLFIFSWKFVYYAWVPFYLHGLTLIQAWISNYTHYKVWAEIICTFPNFNGAIHAGIKVKQCL